MRSVMYFLLGFTMVVVLGALSGCGTYSPHDALVSRAPTHIAICGMGRCDGKEVR